MPRTLLLVEDNELFRGMLRSLLTMRGYNVEVAQRGPEGLAMAAARAYDAVLTDVDMPEMDGFEFCRQVREQQKTLGRDVPVWIMTGMFRPALEKRANASGAVLVLRKPFPIEEVCAQLEREFEKRSEARPAGEPPAAEPRTT
jgi:two-component system, chemotaxis family, chemotaxis protein CheY